MRFLSFAQASVLALAISGAATGGFNAINSGVDMYQKAVGLSEAHWSTTPKMKPVNVMPDDQLLISGNYIYAWVIGRDHLFSRLSKSRQSPLDELRSKGDAFIRLPGDYDDESVVTLIFRVPETPWDAQQMISTIKRHSFFYAVDAGTGFIEIPYFFRGDSRS